MAWHPQRRGARADAQPRKSRAQTSTFAAQTTPDALVNPHTTPDALVDPHTTRDAVMERHTTPAALMKPHTTPAAVVAL